MTASSARLRVACGVGAAVGAVALIALLGAAPAAFAQPLPGAPAGPGGVDGSRVSVASVSVESVSGVVVPGAVVPLVDCVQDAPLGPVTARTVVLGYRSTADVAVSIPAGGGDNDLTAGAADRGQPSTFLPGEHHGVALLTVDAQAEPALGWRVRDAVAAIDASAPACTAATAVTLSAPATAEAGRPFAATAAVTRLLLGAADGGSVAFSLDGGPETLVPVAGGSARADLVAPAAGSHTLAARYLPADDSGLQPATASASLTTTIAAGPLSIAANSVVAGSGAAVVVITRSTGAGEATVDYTTADGTAVSGRDYTAASGTVVLADGVREATVRIPLPARTAGSPAGTFFVLLQRASTSVGTASAAVLLPAVPAAALPTLGTAAGPAAGAAASARADDPDGLSSALPVADPTAGAAGNAAQDLLLLIVGALLTAGGIVGVVSVVRGVVMNGAKA